MIRLTETYRNAETGEIVSRRLKDNTCLGVDKAIKRLWEYENLEEQGLLLRLPCKVGDTVYRICPKCNDLHDGSCEGCAWYGAIFKNGCNIYGYDSSNGLKFQIIPYKVSWEYIPNLIENIGGNVFLTYEEAEKKLKEMEDKANSQRNDCFLIKECVLKGLGEPMQKNGKCFGYQKSVIDDEPCEKCKYCKLNAFYED